MKIIKCKAAVCCETRKKKYNEAQNTSAGTLNFLSFPLFNFTYFILKKILPLIFLVLIFVKGEKKILQNESSLSKEK